MSKNICLSKRFFFVLVSVAIFFLFVSSIIAQTSDWSAPTPLASQGGYVGVSGSGSFVHAVYSVFQPSTAPTPGPGAVPIVLPSPIMYTRSTIEGQDFPTPTSMPNGATGILYLEDTVMTNGNIVAVCHYNNFLQVSDFAGPRIVGSIFISVSTDNGGMFQPPKKLNVPANGDMGANGFALRHSIAISGNNIHVVWMDFRNNKWDIYYNRSRDVGNTWDGETLLVSGENPSGTMGSGAARPQVAVIGNTVHIAWMDGRDKNARCTIEGGTMLPQCTEIYYSKSLMNGDLGTFTTPLRLTTSTTTPDPTYAGRPDVATDNFNMISVLYDKRTPAGNNNNIAIRQSTNGNPFGSEFFLTNSPGVSTHSSAIFVKPILWTLWIG